MLQVILNIFVKLKQKINILMSLTMSPTFLSLCIWAGQVVVHWLWMPVQHTLCFEHILSHAPTVFSHVRTLQRTPSLSSPLAATHTLESGQTSSPPRSLPESKQAGPGAPSEHLCLRLPQSQYLVICFSPGSWAHRGLGDTCHSSLTFPSPPPDLACGRGSVDPPWMR